MSLLAILRNSVFSWKYLFLSPLLFTSLLSSAICKASPPSEITLLVFLAFLFLWGGFVHCLLNNVMDLCP